MPESENALYANIGCVVVHYHSSDTLRHTVDDLARFIPAHRLVVVDNSCDLDKLAFGKDCTIVSPAENLGYAAAVNLGCRQIFGDDEVLAVLVATHETRFDEDSFYALTSRAASVEEPRIVAPVLVTDSNGSLVPWSTGGQISVLGYPRHLRDVPNSDREVLWVDGAAYVVNRAAWEQAGPVPEEFFLYMEDVAHGFRARDAGVRVIVTPSATVYQSPNGPSRSLAVRNRLILIRRYMAPRERALPLLEFFARTLALLASRPELGRANLSMWREASVILSQKDR